MSPSDITVTPHHHRDPTPTDTSPKAHHDPVAQRNHVHGVNTPTRCIDPESEPYGACTTNPDLTPTPFSQKKEIKHQTHVDIHTDTITIPIQTRRQHHADKHKVKQLSPITYKYQPTRQPTFFLVKNGTSNTSP